MKFNKLILAAAIASALAGCYSDDDYTVYNGSGGGGSGGGSSDDKSFVSCNETTNVCTLSGVINENYTLDPDRTWRIQGWTFVGAGNVDVANATDVQALKDDGVILTIPAGVEVKALADAVLVVTRGNKLQAEGTEAQPITFSSLDSNYSGSGEWGGIIIQGFAPQYGFGNTGTCVDGNGVCNVQGEGGAEVGVFGGNEPDDNSGSLKYFRITEGGLVAGPNNEINGLTLQGVGHGTTLDYIQVHGNQDDGIEWFGGTVNLTHAVLTNNDDDDIDYDEGYMGNMQFVFIRKDPVKLLPTGTNDPRGIEANSKVADTKQVSDTTAVLANFTVVGGPAANSGSGQPGVLLRGQVTTDLVKVAVSNFTTKGCVEAKTGESPVVTANDLLCDDDVMFLATTVIASNASQVNINPTVIDLDGDGAINNAQGTLVSTSAPTAIDNGSGFTFVATDYIGAIDTDDGNSTRNWWAGWVIEGSMDGL